MTQNKLGSSPQQINNKETYNPTSLDDILKLEWLTKKWQNIINEYLKDNPNTQINISWDNAKMSFLDFAKIFWNAFLNSNALYKMYFDKIFLTDNIEIYTNNTKVIVGKIMHDWDVGTQNPPENNEELSMNDIVFIKPTNKWKNIIQTYLNENKDGIVWKITQDWDYYEMMFLELTKIFGNWFRAINSDYKIFFEEFWFINQNSGTEVS